jgi:glycosyltransferase involved in cell wall biosynthesis
MRVLLVSRVRLNPYVALLAHGLEQHDAAATIVPEFGLRTLWRARRQGVDVIHLHWLELLTAAPGPRRRALRQRWLLSTLALARRLGIILVYTVHNLTPHEPGQAGLDPHGSAALYRLVDLLHVHDPATAGAVAHQYDRTRGVYVVPHGSYIGAYPNTCTRSAARKHLDLGDDALVFLALGGIRPYKGIETLIDAFQTLDQPQARLLIAGHAHVPAYAAEITARASRDPRIRLHVQHVADDALQYFFQASDACVLPYRQATTSGAAILALSFGCPIVAPAFEPFPPLAAEGRGVLYAADDPQGLVNALLAVAQLDLAAARAACLAYAQALDWRTIAGQHLAAYRSVHGG